MFDTVCILTVPMVTTPYMGLRDSLVWTRKGGDAAVDAIATFDSFNEYEISCNITAVLSVNKISIKHMRLFLCMHHRKHDRKKTRENPERWYYMRKIVFFRTNSCYTCIQVDCIQHRHSIHQGGSIHSIRPDSKIASIGDNKQLIPNAFESYH